MAERNECVEVIRREPFIPATFLLRYAVSCSYMAGSTKDSVFLE
jgi:hypothetical protein